MNENRQAKLYSIATLIDCERGRAHIHPEEIQEMQDKHNAMRTNIERTLALEKSPHTSKIKNAT